jgi:hypothetical protein
MLNDDLRKDLLGNDYGNDGDYKHSSNLEPEEKSTLFKITWTFIMLASGTFTTLFAKSLFETEGEGSEYCNIDDDTDKMCEFNKPWFTVLLMKVSMTFCLVVYYAFGWGKEDRGLPNPSWKVPPYLSQFLRYLSLSLFLCLF